MIEYRSFRNSDPPRLVRLWHACQLGRGAAAGFTSDVFEAVNFSQPYFDPHGLIVACDGAEVVGFAHAGFGANADETGLTPTSSVLCAVLVHPDYRRQGIGRELVRRAEKYAEAAGALGLTAGESASRDPFYFGLYGGARPSGFLESDENAGPFLAAMGYEPRERHAVFQRDISELRDPVSFRLSQIRRQMELRILDRPERLTWWWVTRLGRLDTLRFLLVPKGGGAPVAGLTVVGLDFYVSRWQCRSVGIVDAFVLGSERRKGYGQALLLDVSRRLRQELVTRIEAHADEQNPAAMGMLQSCGFERVDSGVVYGRTLVDDREAAGRKTGDYSPLRWQFVRTDGAGTELQDSVASYRTRPPQ